ncbi:MAG: hypothetical protein QHJ73_14585 [Armatimonadota bacterium]|nr:hypothetical protein [Armatimonadota bacterium]
MGVVRTHSDKVIDPALYTAVILRMQRGERRAAIEKVEQELLVETQEAEAVVDRLWNRYQREVSPEEVQASSRRLIPWSGLAALLLIVAGVAGFVLFR